MGWGKTNNLRWTSNSLSATFIGLLLGKKSAPRKKKLGHKEKYWNFSCLFISVEGIHVFENKHISDSLTSLRIASLKEELDLM